MLPPPTRSEEWRRYWPVVRAALLGSALPTATIFGVASIMADAGIIPNSENASCITEISG